MVPPKTISRGSVLCWLRGTRLEVLRFGLGYSNLVLKGYVVDWDLYFFFGKSSNIVSSPQVHQRLKCCHREGL